MVHFASEGTGQFPRRKPKHETEKNVGRERDGHEHRRDVNREKTGVRCHQHADLQAKGEHNGPSPMPFHSVADQGELHDSEGYPVTETVCPADQLADIQ
jgi:hypothetical protein